MNNENKDIVVNQEQPKTDNIIAIVVEGEVTHVLGVDDALFAALMSNPSFYSLEGVEEEILPGYYYDRFSPHLS